MSDPSPAFPTVRWSNATVTFEPRSDYETTPEATMVVVFAVHDHGFVLADIVGRGWCTPSGRIELGETPLQAALRETHEEIGGTLQDQRELGRYIFTDENGAVRYVPAFLGAVHSYGAIPLGSESRGARLFTRPQLAAQYWLWDDLIDRMFAYAEMEALG